MQRTSLTKLFNISWQKLWQPQIYQPCFFSSLPKNCLLIRSELITAPYFSTCCKRVQLNGGYLSNKFLQNPAKLFTRRAEEETLKVEEFGWAGQPIVKRLHTILPETHENASDIWKFAKKSKSIVEVGNNLDVQLRNFGRSLDIISVENNIPNRTNNLNKVVNTDWTKNRRLHTKRVKSYLQNSGILTRNHLKVKKKKRTVVLASKPGIISKNIPNNAKTKIKKLTKNKVPRTTPTMAINRQFSTLPLPRCVSLLPKRQFQTFSSLGYPKAAVAVKRESKLAVTGQVKEGSLSRAVSMSMVSDDCICPEILYTTGKRKSTKICGETTGVSKANLKKSSYKQKMCLAEPRQEPGQLRTLVCLSPESARMAKRKKSVATCPEPEKKVAPRTIVCPPNIEEEEAKMLQKEKCVKVEEVKIRKKTKVCKPVVIFAKEEIGVKVEKEAKCVSSQMKKIVSKHTKICPPTDKK